MWSSIEQILKPENLTEAAILASKGGTAIFGGGSYLNSQRDPMIRTLIDINHLLDSVVQPQKTGLLVGASCTLQQLIPHVQDVFASAIRSSCPSKNIRNQRTLGGELAEARVDSDLYVLLMVSGVTVHLNGSDNGVVLQDWDGRGIITQIFLPANTPAYERVALLDSAPAYVLVAAMVSEGGTSVVIGGKVKTLVTQSFSNNPDAVQVRDFLTKVASVFQNDHFGSIEYKQQLVSSLLYDLTVNA
jgi:CO/xanthine dehydrogenase FAD-binding subunit